MPSSNAILLIDDNEASRHDMETVLAFIGEETISTASADWRRSTLAAVDKPSDIAVALIGSCANLDELLNEIHHWEAGTPLVLLGGQQFPVNVEVTLKNSLIAVLPKSLGYQPLLDALHKAQVFHEHFNRLKNYEGVRDYNMFRSLVGNSEAVQKIRHMMGQVANTEVSVLITGESGTGKEVVARNLHLNSARAEKPFVPINCGAIPRELLESELFGHEKGAFTGAISSRAGRFELANGGTLFLDEIGDMPLDMQVKLLRVLQERSFERVGGAATIETDVRILAATHKDLEVMIAAGEFRQDLYYRLNVFPIEMPPLRERADDVPLLLNELIGIMEKEQRGSVRFNSAAIGMLCQHHWPGNVRELANLVERMAILYPHGIIGTSDLPEKLGSPTSAEVLSNVAVMDEPEIAGISEASASAEQAPSIPGSDALLSVKGLDLKEYLSNLEKDLIEKALDDSGGVVSRAAQRLNMRRTTLVEKIRKYELQKKQSHGDAKNKTKQKDRESDRDGDTAQEIEENGEKSKRADSDSAASA